MPGLRLDHLDGEASSEVLVPREQDPAHEEELDRSIAGESFLLFKHSPI